jgi:hypothetical protein
MDIRFKVRRYYDTKLGSGKYTGMKDEDLMAESYSGSGSIGTQALSELFNDTDLQSIVATNNFEKTTTVPGTNGLDQLPTNLQTVGQANKLIFNGTDFATPFICYNDKIWKFGAYTPSHAGAVELTAAEVGEHFGDLLYNRMGKKLALQEKNNRGSDATALESEYTTTKDALD